jgi:hypothetical protein
MTLRLVLTFAAAALLAGCSGLASPIGAPGETSQSHTAQGTARGRSWMSPGATGEDLLYLVDSAASVVYVFSYPAGSLVGTLTGFTRPTGECVDASGNIWISNGSTLLEYAHAGLLPIASLNDPGSSPYGCSIDPSTGNLAVANRGGGVAIFAGGAGSGTQYSITGISYPDFAAYDDSGDLFVAGFTGSKGRISELPAGSDTFEKIRLPKGHIQFMGLQWDGGYLTVGRGSEFYDKGLIHRFAIHNNKAVDVGTTRLGQAGAYYIDGSTVAAVWYGVNLYDYPSGQYVKSFSYYYIYQAGGIVVSPSAGRRHRAAAP